MTIKRNSGRPILSLLLYQHLAINLIVKVRGETKVTVEPLVHFAGIAELIPLTSILQTSKNKNHDPKSNMTLARSGATTIKRWVIISVSILV